MPKLRAATHQDRRDRRRRTRRERSEAEIQAQLVSDSIDDASQSWYDAREQRDMDAAHAAMDEMTEMSQELGFYEIIRPVSD